MKFHHIWGVKQKNSPYMLRIIVFCAVKIANREKETETRKGDAMGDYSVLMENEKNIKTERNAKKSDRDIRRKIK